MGWFDLWSIVVFVLHVLPLRESKGAIPIIMIKVNLGCCGSFNSLKPIIEYDVILCCNGSSGKIQYERNRVPMFAAVAYVY
jgi:hypothetical protein